MPASAVSMGTMVASILPFFKAFLRFSIVVVFFPAATFLPLRSAIVPIFDSSRLSRDAPVTNESCVKSTFSARDSVLVVEPHRISIVLFSIASNLVVAVTGTYFMAMFGFLSLLFTA